MRSCTAVHDMLLVLKGLSTIYTHIKKECFERNQISFIFCRDQSQCTPESLVFMFDMLALRDHLRKQGEHSKTAYYTIEILKYQVQWSFRSKFHSTSTSHLSPLYLWYFCIGNGFFLTCEDPWKMFDHSVPTRAFFFFKVEISLCILIPPFMPGSIHNGSASGGNCGQMLLNKLHVSLFPDRFAHYAWTAA